MRYVDIPSIMQIIGAVYIDSSILDNPKYFFTESDFTEEFHKILFGSIYNLHLSGATKVTPIDIYKYLETRPKSLAVYQANKGNEYLQKLEETTQIAAFEYYYQRVKKMTLLRTIQESLHMDLSWLYDIDNILDIKKKQAQEDWLDNTSLSDIVEIIDKKIYDVRLHCITNTDNDFDQAGDGITKLLEDLKQNPEIGYPMFGPLINTVTRGARLGKFYLRSGSTGVGKSRSMIADACTFACTELYNPKTQQWEPNGTAEPTLYIPTEQALDEIQTMMIAFISDVEEDHILNNTYIDGEWERVQKAANILVEAPLYVKQLLDFSLQDIENTIKISINKFGVKYVCLDYIHSSMKILSEITSNVGVKGLREDNILFMLATRLKDICAKYNIFILSGTQLNGDYKNATVFDQNLLRGAKAISDKIDVGIIMVQTRKEDIEAIRDIITTNGFEEPQVLLSVYKNRRGKLTNIILWCKARKGVCKIEPLFATNYNYEIVPIDDLKITVRPSAF